MPEQTIIGTGIVGMPCDLLVVSDLHKFSLKDIGFINYPMNHSQNYFIYSITRYTTQRIQVSWSILKIKILRKMHSTTLKMLHRHFIDGTGQLTEKINYLQAS